MRLLIACLFFFAAACAGTGNDDTAAMPEHGETGGMCGGIAGFACASEGDYCAYEKGACVEIADAAGVCKARPQFCTREYRPVCGCDGKTYPNACDAASNGVSIAADGACKDDQ